MGDTHFLLRHAIVGAIFLLFAWVGWWFFDAQNAWQFLRAQIDSGASAALTAGVASPIIGITIQGVHVLSVYRRRGEYFDDDGRKIVADRMKEIFTECEKDSPIEEDVWTRLREAPADSLFVWLYHRSAPNDLIEWARRRRSYAYLGHNLAIAAAAGAFAGAWAPAIGAAGPVVQGALLLVVAVGWCAGAYLAATLMRRDVDRMELLWAAARRDRNLCRALEEAFGTVVYETFVGSDCAPRSPNPNQNGPARP